MLPSVSVPNGSEQSAPNSANIGQSSVHDRKCNSLADTASRTTIIANKEDGVNLGCKI
jgi:hypothetical protein